MTKAELIDSLQTGATYVCGTAREMTSKLNTEIQEEGTLKLYELDCMTKKGDTLASGGVQSFYVLNEGTDEEEAFFAVNEKADAEEDTFPTELKAYIEAATPDTFLRANIDSIDSDDEFGIVTVYVLADGSVSSKQLFVYKVDGEFTYADYEG